MGVGKPKGEAKAVLALIKKHTKTPSPPPPSVLPRTHRAIPATSLWDKIRRRRNG